MDISDDTLPKRENLELQKAGKHSAQSYKCEKTKHDLRHDSEFDRVPKANMFPLSADHIAKKQANKIFDLGLDIVHIRR